ncbi:MAG: tetratricopeptide repeat protein [Planctomycetota bacterium]
MVNGQSFIRRVQPHLEQGDVEGLAATVRENWQLSDLCRLLSDPLIAVRRTALLTLGLVGDESVVGPVGRTLHDEEEIVVEDAERALWSVWFRLGSDMAAPSFRRGVQLLEVSDWDGAVERLTEAIEADDGFAEAWNQRAIAHYGADRYAESLSDCEETVKRMPSHFGALSGMGHNHIGLGQYEQATDAYERALSVHPRMPAIRDALERLRHRPTNGRRGSNGQSPPNGRDDHANGH